MMFRWLSRWWSAPLRPHSPFDLYTAACRENIGLWGSEYINQTVYGCLLYWQGDISSDCLFIWPFSLQCIILYCLRWHPKLYCKIFFLKVVIFLLGLKASLWHPIVIFCQRRSVYNRLKLIFRPFIWTYNMTVTWLSMQMPLSFSGFFFLAKR